MTEISIEDVARREQQHREMARRLEAAKFLGALEQGFRAGNTVHRGLSRKQRRLTKANGGRK